MFIDVYPIIHRVSTMPGGAGFLPSTIFRQAVRFPIPFVFYLLKRAAQVAETPCSSPLVSLARTKLDSAIRLVCKRTSSIP